MIGREHFDISLPLRGLTPSAFLREAARDAEERGLLDTARQLRDEAWRLEAPQPAPWHDVAVETMPDGSAVELSQAVRVF